MQGIRTGGPLILEFEVVGHPESFVVKDSMFQYLVVLHEDGTVDTYRAVIGGVYEVHRFFFDYPHFEQRMPETANAINGYRRKQ
jgi:hypothetical protein